MSLTKPPVINKTNSLIQACTKVIKQKSASFHIPGHKSHKQFNHFLSNGQSYDLTELVNLDDLYHPQSTIKKIETDLSSKFGSVESIISTNGASSLIIASLIEIAKFGTRVIVPVNSHVSVINALILTGLEPIWLEPDYDENWNLYTTINITKLKNTLSNNKNEQIAGLIITSPTYAGDVSNISQIAQICQEANIYLIVDESHGSHLLFNGQESLSALKTTAHIVIHSLHKTLSALTQSACLHINQKLPFNTNDLKNNLKLISTSSPSYLIMLSIEESLKNLNSENFISVNNIQTEINQNLASLNHIYHYKPNHQIDSWHILIKSNSITSDKLASFLINQGIYPEGLIGNGVLLMLGLGSQNNDSKFLRKALNAFKESKPQTNSVSPKFNKPLPLFNQVMSPRQAYFAKTKTIKVADSLNKISAQNISICPPGTPLIVPGAIITQEIKNNIKDLSIKIVNV